MPRRALPWSRAFLFLLAALAAASCENPKTEANILQSLQDAANTVNGIQQDVETLQAQVDSLRLVVARQDTTIRKLANLANLPIR